MSDWRIRHQDAEGRDAQATQRCREAAIIQALFLGRVDEFDQAQAGGEAYD
jgi:hypothetical protein